MRRKKGSGPIMNARRMAAGLTNPRSGLRPVSPFGYPGVDITVMTPADPFAASGGCPPGHVWHRNEFGGWSCTPTVLTQAGAPQGGPVLPPRTPDWPTLLAYNPMQPLNTHQQTTLASRWDPYGRNRNPCDNPNGCIANPPAVTSEPLKAPRPQMGMRRNAVTRGFIAQTPQGPRAACPDGMVVCGTTPPGEPPYCCPRPAGSGCDGPYDVPIGQTGCVNLAPPPSFAPPRHLGLRARNPRGWGGWGYPGFMPWSRGWAAPAQSYDLGPSAQGGTSVEVGPGPGGQVYFPGPYTPEQAATVGASYIGSRGGYPVAR